ncbi:MULTISPECIES: hypothetical protein [Burkholderia]|uniref:hypothetical protein n=1 Tax=Burkholderia TaxID=32008 RepID=UPI001907758C|nr:MULTISPECIES: hypothetical protein [Burkholderia]MBJ9920627.1 hypothetical protein [Burkholderia cenocepacia]UVS90888.1 hypothetical protein EFP17_14575 [Burkholderia glumae]
MTIISSIQRFRYKRCCRAVESLSPQASASRLNAPLKVDVVLDVGHKEGQRRRLTPVGVAGQPMWQAAFNRICLGTELDEWVPLLDAYLAAGATGVTRNQALTEAAARAAVQGGRGHRGGTLPHGARLADGTFVYDLKPDFVPTALSHPELRELRQEVLNFALRNLYMNPELVKVLLAEGAEPGYHVVQHGAEDATYDPACLASLDLLLDAGGDVSGIELHLWAALREVRVHVENAELRQFIEDIELSAAAAEIEVEAPPVHRPRRRL